MPRVFISYSHDDDDHVARVHALADRLAKEKVADVILDRDTGPGGPDEGWPEWSERQVLEADYVLIACSEVYARRYEGNDDSPERGQGTVTEARAIRQYIYDTKGRNARFRVVLFDSANKEHIPTQLRSYHFFNASDAGSYAELCAWINKGMKDVDAPDPEGPVWPAPDLKFRLPLADRRPHFAAIRAALSGYSTNRIFLLKGEGNSGKTQFLNKLSSYAEQIKLPWTRFDFKGAPPLHEIFENILMDLGELLPTIRDAHSNTPLVELVNDLKKLTTPVLFLFDTFEKASDESQKWLETKFLPRIRNLPAVIVVIGGRSVPEKGQYPWNALADFRTLEPIKNVEDWKEYLGQVHGVDLDPEHIELLTRATHGSPGMLRPLLENLAARRDAE